MMEDIFFSIVMPVYNKEKYIKTTIDSILNQSYSKFELIIVNDQSTDGSLDIIQSYKDERIVLINKINGGSSSARNLGIINSKNKYIAFIDADDYWYSDFLETMKNLIVKFSTYKVFGCCYLHEQICEIIPERNTKGVKEFIIEDYFKFILEGKQALTASTAVVERSVFAEVGLFPNDIKNWEDLDMWGRIACKYKIVHTTKICAIYNDVINSASKNYTYCHIPLFDNYNFYLDHSSLSEDEKESFYNYVAFMRLNAAYSHYLFNKKKAILLKEIWKFKNCSMEKKQIASYCIQLLITPSIFLKIMKKR